MRELMYARLPHREFAYGGADWGKVFVLDERDQLTERAEEVSECARRGLPGL
jgi:hypothetical protein